MDNYLKDLQREIGYVFKNIDLLKQACIRKTYSEEKGGPNNEVLEHVGDAALGMAVEKILISTYSKIELDGDLKCLVSQLSEEQLTEKKKVLVQKKTLSNRIDELSFNRFLIVGNGDNADNASVKEDFFEAIIGAVALDCDFDFSIIMHVVDTMLSPFDYLTNEDVDYVSKIQKWCQIKHGYLPSYEFLNSHRAKTICWYGNAGAAFIKSDNFVFGEDDRFAFLQMPGVGERVFIGSGKSNSLARRAAAKCAYEFLNNNNLLWTIKDEIEEPSLTNSINQLQTLADRGYIKRPRYTQREERDFNGNSIWHVRCTVDEVCSCEKNSSKIKNAKKEAAYAVLLNVLKNTNS